MVIHNHNWSFAYTALIELIAEEVVLCCYPAQIHMCRVLSRKDPYTIEVLVDKFETFSIKDLISNWFHTCRSWDRHDLWTSIRDRRWNNFQVRLKTCLFIFKHFILTSIAKLAEYAITHWSQCRAVNRMSRLGLPPIYVVRATLAEFGPHAGNTKSNTQNEVWISKHTILYLILPVYILYIMCKKNIKTGKID